MKGVRPVNKQAVAFNVNDMGFSQMVGGLETLEQSKNKMLELT